jgi:hypothetical protein
MNKNKDPQQVSGTAQAGLAGRAKTRIFPQISALFPVLLIMVIQSDGK